MCVSYSTVVKAADKDLNKKFVLSSNFQGSTWTQCRLICICSKLVMLGIVFRFNSVHYMTVSLVGSNAVMCESPEEQPSPASGVLVPAVGSLWLWCESPAVLYFKKLLRWFLDISLLILSFYLHLCFYVINLFTRYLLHETSFLLIV